MGSMSLSTRTLATLPPAAWANETVNEGSSRERVDEPGIGVE
jgi:hypothetical protein